MIWLTKCLNTLRRWSGRPEKPPAVYGDTSILFVLQSKSPQTRAEISAATRISEDQLIPILTKLENQGRIRSTLYRQELSRQYWAIRAD
jgi:DNA-binding HxlR family transcriptional regulator